MPEDGFAVREFHVLVEADEPMRLGAEMRRINLNGSGEPLREENLDPCIPQSTVPTLVKTSG
jgi:hypothetical protein